MLITSISLKIDEPIVALVSTYDSIMKSGEAEIKLRYRVRRSVRHSLTRECNHLRSSPPPLSIHCKVRFTFDDDAYALGRLDFTSKLLPSHQEIAFFPSYMQYIVICCAIVGGS